MLKTYFAPAERAGEKELAVEIDLVGHSAVLSGLLHSVGGVLAVLNEDRQVVALNAEFIRMLGIDDPQGQLGLRLGEVLECVHAGDAPHGCGTTRLCESCGAAVAMVASLGEDRPVERLCALTAQRDGRPVDTAFMVRSQPIRIDGRRFLLLFLQDVTASQQRAALERVFFHDVNNMLNILIGSSEMLVEDHPSPLARSVLAASLRLHEEVAIQRLLAEGEGGYRAKSERVEAAAVLEELGAFFAAHPAARGRRVVVEAPPAGLAVRTDPSLAMRVLINMVTNALEATDRGGEVKAWCEPDGDRIAFGVWNTGEIDPAVAPRVFQRHFSTKEQAGRGSGTYSMKLFGERILGGEVTFTTSSEAGTVFRFALSRHP